jgi:hypothetical protein
MLMKIFHEEYWQFSVFYNKKLNHIVLVGLDIMIDLACISVVAFQLLPYQFQGLK